jgi:hypothetical protein
MSVDARVRRTDCSCSIKIDRAAPLQIVIQPTASSRKWTAHLGDRLLCVSAWPFVKSARRLLAEGHASDIMIEMWRPNAAEFALRGRLGAVAATVIDGETASRGAKNGTPVRDHVQSGQRALPLACARPKAVSGGDDRPLGRSKHSQRHTARPARRKRLGRRHKTRPRR